MPQIGEIRKGTEVGLKGTCRHTWHACIDCGKERWVELSHNQPRSLRCQTCASKRNLPYYPPGKGHFNWKGGRHKGKDGYISIALKPDDFFRPMGSKSGSVREHRLVMAKHLNRCLLSWEIVHHKGTLYPSGSRENRSDNRIENLELLPSQHKHFLTILMEKELRKRDKRIKELEQRITLLEAGKALTDAQYYEAIHNPIPEIKETEDESK